MRVALTFDAEFGDRPADLDRLDDLLAELAHREVPATFFVQGAWAQAHPSFVRGMVVNGHLIGNHSQWHAPMSALTEAGQERTVIEAEGAIEEACGVNPQPWFRCPYGDGRRSKGITRMLRANGYKNIGWDIDAMDWPPKAESADIAERVRAQVALREGRDTIIVMHSWPNPTARAVALLAPQLLIDGVQLVRLDAIDFDVTSYWENRYRKGRSSGPGSEGQEALLKAGYINRVVREYGVQSIVDYGCGDGEVASLLKVPYYTGCDISHKALELCAAKLAGRLDREWVYYSGAMDKPIHADLALSLDVIFHLVPDDLYRQHLALLFASAPLVCIQSSNKSEEGWPHVRHREWLKDVPAGWMVVEKPTLLDAEGIGMWLLAKEGA